MRLLPFMKPKNGYQFAGGGFESGGGGGGGGSSLNLNVGENIIGSFDGKDLVCKVIKLTNGSISSGENYVMLTDFVKIPLDILSFDVVYMTSSSWHYNKNYDTSLNASYVSYSVSSSYSYEYEYIIITYLAESEN